MTTETQTNESKTSNELKKDSKVTSKRKIPNIKDLWRQHLKRPTGAFQSIRNKPKQWVSENYLLQSLQGGKLLRTFNISEIENQPKIIKAIQLSIWANTNKSTGEIKYNMVLDFRLFDDASYRFNMKHKISNVFNIDTKRVKEYKKHLNKEAKKHTDDAQFIFDDIKHLDAVNECFKEFREEQTGMKVLRDKELSFKYQFFPCINSYVQTRNSRAPYMRGFYQLNGNDPFAESFKGTFYLAIGLEEFEIPFVRINDNTGEDTFVGEYDRGELIVKGYYHRDQLQDQTKIWKGYTKHSI